MRKPDKTDMPTLHDFMQPLNIISLSCDNLRKRVSIYQSEDVHYIIKKMERIEKQTIRLRQLLQGLKSLEEKGEL